MLWPNLDLKCATGHNDCNLHVDVSGLEMIFGVRSHDAKDSVITAGTVIT